MHVLLCGLVCVEVNVDVHLLATRVRYVSWDLCIGFLHVKRNCVFYFYLRYTYNGIEDCILCLW